MKSLEKENIPQFLEILQKKPAQRLVHFCDNGHILSDALHAFCLAQDNEYYLYCTTPEYYEASLGRYAGKAQMYVKNFNLRRPRYMMQTIEYDYLIATLDIELESKADFLAKCYPIIRTGGNIIILIPSTSGYAILDEWRDILTEQYYVSINVIHDIFENVDVIVAKRMHGWGN